MISYKVDNEIYDLPEDQVNDFLIDYPDAEKIDQPGKTDPTTPGAVVENDTAPDMDSKSDPTLLELQKKVDALDPLDNSQEAIILRKKLKELEGPIAEIPLQNVTVVGKAKPGKKGPLKESKTIEGIDKKIVDFLPEYKNAISIDNVDKDIIKENVANRYFDLSGLKRPIEEINNDPRLDASSLENRITYKNDRETDILNYFGEKKYKEYQNYLETNNLPTTEIIQQYTDEEVFNFRDEKGQFAMRNIDEDVRNAFRMVVETDEDLLKSLDFQTKKFSLLKILLTIKILNYKINTLLLKKKPKVLLSN